MKVTQIGLALFWAISPFFLSATESQKPAEGLMWPESKSVSSVSSAFNLFVSNEKKLNQVIEEQIKSHQKSADSQKKVSSLADETEDIIHEYEVTLSQIESARNYNKQIRKLIADQTEEMSSIRTQIVEVKQTSKDILPLMLEMIKSLEKFISMDIPFLKKERKNRLEEIKKIMDRAALPISEKYRRLMEAYQEETNYGRTLEYYQGFQNVEGKTLSVNYLRVGRITLIYQSLDGKKQAYWDNSKKQWIKLPSSYRRAVEEGLKMAKKQKAPDLIVVPIPAPIKTHIQTQNKEEVN